ncbi:MAG: hypothetical protein M3Y69_04635 [Verrucomicrobiota bacterium]|nr:hypothetical protein [Verrucomicrobiota bacterium]
MKGFLATFELTLAEQRTVVTLLLLFVLLFAAKKYHDGAFTHTAAIVQPSPSPGTRP